MKVWKEEKEEIVGNNTRNFFTISFHSSCRRTETFTVLFVMMILLRPVSSVSLVSLETNHRFLFFWNTRSPWILYGLIESSLALLAIIENGRTAGEHNNRGRRLTGKERKYTRTNVESECQNSSTYTRKQNETTTPVDKQQVCWDKCSCDTQESFASFSTACDVATKDRSLVSDDNRPFSDYESSATNDTRNMPSFSYKMDYHYCLTPT